FDYIVLGQNDSSILATYEDFAVHLSGLSLLENVTLTYNESSFSVGWGGSASPVFQIELLEDGIWKVLNPISGTNSTFLLPNSTEVRYGNSNLLRISVVKNTQGKELIGV